MIEILRDNTSVPWKGMTSSVMSSDVMGEGHNIMTPRFSIISASEKEEVSEY